MIPLVSASRSCTAIDIEAKRTARRLRSRSEYAQRTFDDNGSEAMSLVCRAVTYAVRAGQASSLVRGVSSFCRRESVIILTSVDEEGVVGDVVVHHNVSDTVS